MLLQNPQLGYALLQAQIIMKIVDPQVAAVIIKKLLSILLHENILVFKIALP